MNIYEVLKAVGFGNMQTGTAPCRIGSNSVTPWQKPGSRRPSFEKNRFADDL